MRTWIPVAAVAAATCAGPPALAASDAECKAMWKKADANNDGKLSDAEAQRYFAMMRVRDHKLPPDNHLDRATFMNECKADVFTQQKAGAGRADQGREQLHRMPSPRSRYRARLRQRDRAQEGQRRDLARPRHPGRRQASRDRRRLQGQRRFAAAVAHQK